MELLKTKLVSILEQQRLRLLADGVGSLRDEAARRQEEYWHDRRDHTCWRSAGIQRGWTILLRFVRGGDKGNGKSSIDRGRARWEEMASRSAVRTWRQCRRSRLNAHGALDLAITTWRGTEMTTALKAVQEWRRSELGMRRAKSFWRGASRGRAMQRLMNHMDQQAAIEMQSMQVVLMQKRFCLLRRLQSWQQQVALGVLRESFMIDAVLHWTIQSLNTSLGVWRGEARHLDLRSPSAGAVEQPEWQHVMETTSSDRESLHSTWAILHFTLSTLSSAVSHWRGYAASRMGK
eukprot:TRINITY_DN21381_c0_g1_i1.p1 TRINITY_DN21381_c0_g1~~TRINITY_DN21381_c0_g1_i1.p1  ORF type:complete len:291 (+),score=47.36 TRINITY_DN21381_c0_g1_i1:289-1161(+)